MAISFRLTTVYSIEYILNYFQLRLSSSLDKSYMQQKLLGHICLKHTAFAAPCKALDLNAVQYQKHNAEHEVPLRHFCFQFPLASSVCGGELRQQVVPTHRYFQFMLLLRSQRHLSTVERKISRFQMFDILVRLFH
jgi:hypothetical protein